ncbi:hypothetical protein [Pseudooceanicola atlanticus]|uniref:Class I SAM-dependent methyltransferase n=1 Tax=Pseudooceanicola atlanticus TaxID=1461694 RepID=A0A0A0EC60_9RHOB|nr:hypothetical protein [Pseudooceanicola atlanticus]KGM47703.1 hypothetical protein ATO9_16680 [Pseudooceanicola atlanticus]
MEFLSEGPVARPELTLPPEEAAFLRERYAEATEILEYGSGGSTVVASELDGKTITSVESDRDWADMMQRWFKENPGKSPVDVFHADIGPTKDWGYPTGPEEWRRFPSYPLRVWERAKEISPDLVLVDGRFRVGCVLATALSTQKPLTLLFDDYTPRKAYRRVEGFVGEPQKIVGRMAVFAIEPMSIPKGRYLRTIELMCAPL